jgi:hypothetical protein
MRRHQLLDIINWCEQDVGDENMGVYHSLQAHLDTEPVQTAIEGTHLTPIYKTRHQAQKKTLQNFSPWELAQYFAIYDYLYISHVLEVCSLKELLNTSADESTTLSEPDLRAEQVQTMYTVLITASVLGNDRNFEESICVYTNSKDLLVH